jgi:hypothetical protein
MWRSRWAHYLSWGFTQKCAAAGSAPRMLKIGYFVAPNAGSFTRMMPMLTGPVAPNVANLMNRLPFKGFDRNDHQLSRMAVAAA